VLRGLLLREDPVAGPFGMPVGHAPEDNFRDFQA
jgi:hypothetical protein